MLVSTQVPELVASLEEAASLADGAADAQQDRSEVAALQLRVAELEQQALKDRAQAQQDKAQLQQAAREAAQRKADVDKARKCIALKVSGP